MFKEDDLVLEFYSCVVLSAGAPHFTKLPRTYLAICPCFGDAFDIVHHLLDCLKLNIDSRAKLYQKCQTGVLGTFLPSVSRSSDQRVPNIAGSETKLYLVFQVQCSEANSEAAIYMFKCFWQVLQVLCPKRHSLLATAHPG